jgi:hypothetical protein
MLRRATLSIPNEKSSPYALLPTSRSALRFRPVPHPTSRMRCRLRSDNRFRVCLESAAITAFGVASYDSAQRS